jgi:opacity protein-like surface antigen
MAVALIAVSVFPLIAQDSTPRVQAFGGYSLFHADNGGVNGLTLDEDLREPNSPFGTKDNFMGWNAEGQYNATRILGIAVDGGGRYGMPITESRFSKLAGLPNGNGYSLLVGPVLSYRTKSKLTPFIHALFGYDRVTVNASTITGLSVPVSSTATTFTDFALALGAGVDYRVLRMFSIRLAQVDDLETTHNLNHFYGTVFPTGVFEGLGTHERNVRISTGVVVSF